MQPEQGGWADGGGGEEPFLGAGADSSNRPWETDSLRIGEPAVPVALGYLACTAAALLAIADVALLYSPRAAYTFGNYEPLADIPRWRLLLGHYLGILVLPAYIAGYWLVFCGLRGAGPWRSWPVLLLGAYGTAVAGAFHGLLALVALMVHQGAAGDPTSGGALVEQARAFTDPLHGLVIALFVLGSLWFAIAVASGASAYPRWLAAANPLALAALLVLPYYLAPGFAPARLLLPASFNLAHLVFFALVTAALASHRKAAGLLPPP